MRFWDRASSGIEGGRSNYEQIDDVVQTSAGGSIPLSPPSSSSQAGDTPGELRSDLFAPAPDTHQVLVRDVKTTRPGGRLAPTHSWDHIENLDQFFCRIYDYHQRGGFVCLCVQLTLELAQFVFVVGFCTFLMQCIDYAVLFKQKLPPKLTAPVKYGYKLTVADAVIDQCLWHLHPGVVFCLLVATAFLLLRLVRAFYQVLRYAEIRAFYQSALKIDDAQLENTTWHEVLQRLCQVQRELHLCVNQMELTELDVYQRILRHKNYMVAMVNKGLLPVNLNVASTELGFLSEGFKLNFEWIFFWGPFSPWQDYYCLRSEYKQRENLSYLTARLEQIILYMGLVNLLLAPFIFVWQVLHTLFTFADLLKREPGAVGMRRWSNYGRYFVRHLNELDHELNQRLNRAYRPACQYMDLFVGPLSELIGRYVAFCAGAIFAVIAILGAWDEDVLQVITSHLPNTLLFSCLYFCLVLIFYYQMVNCDVGVSVLLFVTA